MSAARTSAARPARSDPAAPTAAQPAARNKKPAAKILSAKQVQAKANGALMSDGERRNYVEVAAYYIAERRGFADGDPLDDWLQAEQEVERMLGRQ